MILLMGIAGSGKGTQGKLLSESRDLQLISMGEVLRKNVTGPQRERMLSGGLLDDSEIIEIVDKELSSLPDKQKVILDGFPRTIAQAEWLLNKYRSGQFTIEAAFHLVASQNEVKQRLLSRARIDDVDQAIEERFSEYERSTAPLLKWLTENGINIIDVDAERSIEAINKDLVNYLDQNQ